MSESNLANQENLGNILRPKKLKITLLSRDNMPVQTLELIIKPKEQFCDQVYRFYEPQSSQVYLKLPQGFAPFFTLSKGMSVRSSSSDMIPDLNFETGEVCLVAQTERAPRKTECFVFLYQDNFQSTLLACCKVEIYSMLCMRQKLQAGAPETLIQLQLRSPTKRTVEFFSSNQRLVYAPGGQKKERHIQVI